MKPSVILALLVPLWLRRHRQRLLLLLATSLACAARETPEQHAGAGIPLRKLQVRAQFPPTPQPAGTAVLADSASWEAWRKHTRAEAPAVDVRWQEESVVALVTPAFVDGPTVVAFERAHVVRDTLVIEYRLTFPEQRYDMTSQECAAAAVPRTHVVGHPVRFEQLPTIGPVPPTAAPAT